MTEKETREPARQAPARKATPKAEAPTEANEEATVLTVGGYVNRDDGAGWVLEEE